MEKYETEFKLKVVESFLAGEGGAKLLARRWSVPEEKIRAWVSHYRWHGITGLRPKRGSYTGHFKFQVLAHQDRERPWSARSRNCAGPMTFSRRQALFSPRRSSTADSSPEGLHRPIPGRVRDRADLQSLADRPVRIPAPCCAASQSGIALPACSAR